MIYVLELTWSEPPTSWTEYEKEELPKKIVRSLTGYWAGDLNADESVLEHGVATFRFQHRPLGPELLTDLKAILGDLLMIAYLRTADHSETLFYHIREEGEVK